MSWDFFYGTQILFLILLPVFVIWRISTKKK